MQSNFKGRRQNMFNYSIDNILDNNDVKDIASELFSNDGIVEETDEKKDTSSTVEDDNKKDSTTDGNRDHFTSDFFDQESVGSEDIKNKEGVSKKPVNNTSPSNIYSSFTKALAEDGALPDLDEETINSVKDAESFLAMFNKMKEMALNETQKRINDALNNGVPNTEIQRYEGNLNYLNSITNEMLEAETEEGDNLRKKLLYHEYINRGYSQERAVRLIERSFKDGQDIEDAKDALQSNIEFYKEEYNKLVNKAKEERNRQIEEEKKNDENMKKSILDDDKVFGDISIDKATRQKVLDNIQKPIWKDPATGELYTAIQKYEKENHNEFIKKLGLLFTLTDGFKSLDKVINSQVKRKVNESLKNIEYTLNNTSRYNDGSLKYVTSADSDETRYWKNKGIIDVNLND